MRISIVVFAAIVLAGLVVAQSKLDAQIHVRVLPPQDFPAATCSPTKAAFGYLGDAKGGNKPTAAEIGQYIIDKTKEGYSVTLYPQPSGRIWTSEKCESVKASAAP